jgi:hypothetical protein
LFVSCQKTQQTHYQGVILQGCIKDEARAQQHRVEGNQLFKQGAWAAAAQEYTCEGNTASPAAGETHLFPPPRPVTAALPA